MNWVKTAVLTALLLLLCACAPQPEKNGFVMEESGLHYYEQNAPVTFQAGVQQIGEKCYYILSDGQTVCSQSSGLYTAEDGKLYYFEPDCSLRYFEPGLVSLPEGQVCVRSAGYALDLLTGQLAEVEGVLYAFDEDSFLMELPAGVQELFGQLRLVTEEGIACPEPGLLRLEDGLYYVREDGSLLTSETVGYLTFGSDGRYTSGNEELDAAVADFFALCLTEETAEPEAMLRAAYEYFRDNYRYLSGDFHPAGSTDWAEDCALTFFTLGKGNCYCWAAGLMYCARQLGYQAYVVSGWESNPSNVHAWTMIDWPDGQTYLFDPQLEYAYWYMFSGKTQIDMFKASGDGLVYNGFNYYFP